MLEAFLGRDTNFDGVFVTGVHTTGIFCRPTCSAKKPLRKNCRSSERVEKHSSRDTVPACVVGPSSQAERLPTGSGHSSRRLKPTRLDAGPMRTCVPKGSARRGCADGSSSTTA